MKRTSIKNELILSFLGLLLIVMVVVGIATQITNDFIAAHTISAALGLAAAIIFGGIFSRSIVRRLNNLSSVAKEISRGDLSKEIPLLSRDEIRDLEASTPGDPVRDQLDVEVECAEFIERQLFGTDPPTRGRFARNLDDRRRLRRGLDSNISQSNTF